MKHPLPRAHLWSRMDVATVSRQASQQDWPRAGDHRMLHAWGHAAGLSAWPDSGPIDHLWAQKPAITPRECQQSAGQEESQWGRREPSERRTAEASHSSLMNAISLPEEFANGASGNLSLLMASLNTDAIKPAGRPRLIAAISDDNPFVQHRTDEARWRASRKKSPTAARSAGGWSPRSTWR